MPKLKEDFQTRTMSTDTVSQPKLKRLLILQSFSGVPHVFATAVHVTTQNKYDAASVWVEDVTHVSFKLCLRELKNYDGEHEHIKVVSTFCFSLYSKYFVQR